MDTQTKTKKTIKERHAKLFEQVMEEGEGAILLIAEKPKDGETEAPFHVAIGGTGGTLIQMVGKASAANPALRTAFRLGLEGAEMDAMLNRMPDSMKELFKGLGELLGKK